MSRPLRTALLLLALAAAIVATFAQSLGGGFVYDDRLLIQLNPALRSLANLPEFFGSAYWDFTDPDYASRIGYWRPLAATTLALGHQVADGAPVGFRLVSILVHLAATGAAFALARRLGLAAVPAALAAALFALHPIQVEAVAWPSSVTDPLLALFCFVTLERWAAWRERGSPGLPIAALLGLAGALLTKETGVLLLVALPAHDLFFGHLAPDADGRRAPRLRPALAAGVVLAAYFGLRVAVFDDWSGGVGRVTTDLQLGFARRELLRVEILGDALGTLLAPVDLRVFRPIDPQRGWFEPETLLELGAIALAVGGGLLAWRRGRPRVALGAVLAVAPLLPLVLRLESLGQYPVTDRYLVVPAFGLGLALASLVERLPAVALGRAALAALAVLGAFAAHARVPIWLDEETLFATAVEETPDSLLPRWSYGRVLLERFQESTESELDPALLERALEQFTTALDLAQAHIEGRGTALTSSFDIQQANIGQADVYLLLAPLEGYDDYATPRELYETLLERYPDSANAWYGLGRVRFETDDLEGARKAFERALRLDPTLAGAQQGIGLVYYYAGRLGPALEAFEQVLELRSGELEDRLWAARAAIELGRLGPADEHLERARAIDPDEAEVDVLAGMADEKRRDLPAALQHAEDALRLDPEHALAHNLRGRALLGLGDGDEALLAFRRACDFGPALFEPHYNVASALLARGASEAAAPYLDRAYRLCPNPGIRTSMRGELARAVEGDLESLLTLVRADLGRRDLEPALQWARLALAAAPDDREALRAVAEVHRRRREPELALPHLRRADALYPDTFGIVNELALCLVEARRFDEAQVELARALELLPPASRFPGGAAMRGMVREELERALEALPGATPIGPNPEPDATGTAEPRDGGR